VARSKKRRDGSIYKAWRCYEGARNGSPHTDKAGNRVGCSCPSLNDEDAKQLLKGVLQALQIDREAIIQNLATILQTATQEPDGKAERLDAKLAQVTEKKQRLLDLYLNKELPKADFKQMSEKLEREIAGYQAERTALLHHAEVQKNREKLLEDIAIVLRDVLTGQQWDDTFYSQILDSITLHSGGRVDVNLKLSAYSWDFFRRDHFGSTLPTSVSTPVTSP
jgi:hypothetical protein